MIWYTVQNTIARFCTMARRKWLSLYRYRNLYGEIKMETADLRSDKTICKWCGRKLSGRRTSFCSDKCSRAYNRFLLKRPRPPLPWFVLIRDRFSCQDCGISAVHFNEFEMPIPYSEGLEIHHVIPVSQKGTDHVDNLITVCTSCHHLRHRKLKEEACATKKGMQDI